MTSTQRTTQIVVHLIRGGSLLWILLALLCTDVQAQRQAKVLVIHSYHQGYRWTSGQHQGFEAELKRQLPDWQLGFYTDYLDTKRRSYTPEYFKILDTFLTQKYQGFKPDLIYTTDDNALRFALGWTYKTFPELPMVFSGVNDLRKQIYRSSSIDGVFERAQLGGNLELIQSLWPGETRVIFVGDGTSTYIAMRESVDQMIRAKFSGIQPIFIAARNLSRMLNQLKEYESVPVILTTIGGFTDRNGDTIALPQVVQQIRQAGNYRIFAMEDTYLMPGVIGGWVNSSQAQGAEAAKIAAAMLNGKHQTPTEGITFPAEPVFNFPDLQNHRIPLRALPPGRRLLNEPFNLFTQYRQWVLFTLGGVVGLLGIILMLSLNIRRRQRAEKESQASRWQMTRLFEDAPDAIIIVDLAGQVLDVNQHAAESLQYDRSQLREMTVFQFDMRITTEKLADALKTLKTEEALTVESVHRRADDSSFPVDIRITHCQWEGQPALMCFVRNITNRKEVEQQLLNNEERLNYLAHHDPLTDLPNRLLFGDRLDHALDMAKRHQTGLGVLFLDLDRFKNINDSLGHDVGDRVLEEVAVRLQNALRSSDTVARLGGDEFVVLIEDVNQVSELMPVAQKILDRVQPPINVNDRELYVTTSLGIAVYPDDAETPQGLMKSADIAMYKAKEQGNSYCFYQAQMDARATEFLFLESSLRRALEANQLTLHYQPQFELEEQTLIGFEALMRWNHPEQGLIPPGDFIPLAEESGLIVPMGEWSLRETCRQLRQWFDQGLCPVPVAVNISPRQFHLPDWHLTVMKILQEYDLNPALLELEITENLLMRDTEAAIQTLDELHRLGVSVSIDDFGSGYSSMAYLKRFPLKKLKIDQSFISDINHSVNNASIVCAVITMGWSLGLQIVAEGIETQDQLQFLKDQGCHQGQGYLLGRPTPVDELERWLSPPTR